MKKSLIAVLIIFPPFLVKAQLLQQRTVDSLIKLSYETKGDTNKIIILNKISSAYFTINAEKGLYYANQALQLAQKIGWKKGVAKAYNTLGSNYWTKYQFNKAQDYFGLTLKVAEEIKDKALQARALLNIGVCYDAQNLYSGAIDYYQRSLKIYRQLGIDDLVLGCLSNIAGNYLTRLKYNEALNYYGQCLQLASRTHKERFIGFFSQKMGTVNLAIGNTTEAFKYDNIALGIYQRLKSNEDIMTITAGLGAVYFKTGDYAKAISHYQTAMIKLKQFNGRDPTSLSADYYCAIGKSYFKWAHDKSNRWSVSVDDRKKYTQLALKYLQKAILISRSVDYKECLIESLAFLSNVQISQKQFERALVTFKQYVVARDSLHGIEAHKSYENHELIFEYNKKRDSLFYQEKLERVKLAEAKAATANRVKQLSLSAIIVIVILLLIVTYTIFTNRINKIRFKAQLSKEKADIELKQILFENKLNDLTLASLKSQMNPHFIFNCLNSIKFYTEKNETEAASLYITKFSRLIRNILDSARSDRVTLSAEIELVKLYLDMEQMRLKDKLRYEFEIAKNIDVDFIEIPPLIIQPYVENAIWHGLMHREEGGRIKLSMNISPDEKQLIITIEDDGIGREKAAEIKKNNIFKHTSHGSKLNDERIAMYNAKYKTNTEVIITDLRDSNNHPSGTLVTLKLLLHEIFESNNY